MSASLKASADGTQAIIQVGGVDKVVIDSGGIASGYKTGSVPAVSLAQPLTLGTVQNTTSGTSIDFTGIPSWVKRLTVAFRGVSTNGSSNLLVQIGSGSVQTSGYQSATGNGGVQHTSTAGMVMETGASTLTVSALMTFINIGSNVWVASFSGGVQTMVL